jgi:outer membrane protein insertion porin family
MAQRSNGIVFTLACTILFIASVGCNTTKYLKDGQYLLRSNTVKLKSDRSITKKGELKDNLEGLIVQKPNTYFLGFMPYKVWLYNNRYEKYQRDTNNFQLKSKTVEKPAVYDSASKEKTAINIKGYLFQQGYFYAYVTDTTRFRGKRAFVTYKVNTGTNYLINKVTTDVPDSAIAQILRENFSETKLKNKAEFSYPLLQEEQSRITMVMRDYGYYKFNNDNITFELDTLVGSYTRDVENPFETTLNLITFQKRSKKPTLNIRVILRADEDPKAFEKYAISRVRVFPDFVGREDIRDSSMIEKTIDNITFRYHNYYVHEKVLLRHIFMEPNKYYSQSNYDLTISKLNELGIFQTSRVTLSEDSTRKEEGNWLNCTIILTPGKKLDFNTNLEGSTGNTYAAGSAATISFRNRNVAKGANLLTTTLSAGIELRYDSTGTTLSDHLKLLTRSAGFNTSLDMPKFVVPFNIKNFSKATTPRTVFGAGINLLDRVQYFNLINTSASMTYKWKETKTKSWEITPAFINDIRLPYISDTFKKRLADNSFLRNTYKQTFIEGENIAFIFSDKDKKFGRNYSYLRLSLEEAGGIMKGLSSVFGNNSTNYAQYVKFDFDAEHFFTLPSSMFAFRFYGGIGLPYDKSSVLPYIKQYFVGGAYSIRGWRIRQLGPGSYSDSSRAVNLIDRTGDIKLELNGEYRFDVIQLFAGAIKLKGALFADAGNIWLANKSASYPGGEFAFNKLGHDIAVSTGTGARLDIGGFFVVRFDVAFPVKNPAYPENGGWVADQFFGYRSWARDNLVYNFAINYPF